MLDITLMTLSGIVVGGASGALTVLVCWFGKRSLALIDEYLWSITEALEYGAI